MDGPEHVQGLLSVLLGQDRFHVQETPKSSLLSQLEDSLFGFFRWNVLQNRFKRHIRQQGAGSLSVFYSVEPGPSLNVHSLNFLCLTCAWDTVLHA